jgi:hypothetical protein
MIRTLAKATKSIQASLLTRKIWNSKNIHKKKIKNTKLSDKNRG